LTGAVHLSNDNAGVLRPAQLERKSSVEQKGKCWLDLSLQYGARSRNVGLSILFISEFEERGVRKITTGITGLWRPSVHSDVVLGRSAGGAKLPSVGLCLNASKAESRLDMATILLGLLFARGRIVLGLHPDPGNLVIGSKCLWLS